MNSSELKAEMIRNNDNGESLAKALGIARQTLSLKINNRGSEFTQREISIIKERYNLSPERIVAIFFAV